MDYYVVRDSFDCVKEVHVKMSELVAGQTLTKNKSESLKEEAVVIGKQFKEIYTNALIVITHPDFDFVVHER